MNVPSWLMKPTSYNSFPRKVSKEAVWLRRVGRNLRMRRTLPLHEAFCPLHDLSSCIGLEAYKQMLAEMRYPSLDDARALLKGNPKQWILCDQTYYKQIYFFPTTAFTFAQMLVFLILHVSIVYVS
eukprot:gene9955-biopygen5002